MTLILHGGHEIMGDDFRSQSDLLIDWYLIVGAHLVLAAASLASTCDDKRVVAEKF